MKNIWISLLLLIGFGQAFRTATHLKWRPGFSSKNLVSRPPLSSRSHTALSALAWDKAAETSQGALILPEATFLDNPTLSSPVFWTTSVLLIIVGLLIAWETMVERAKEATPPAITTVIENILMEMGSLGFVGLILSAVLNNPVSPLQTAVAHVSQEYLHDPELLLESFHFLHELFFQAAIVYFFGSAFMTQRVIDSIEFASNLAEQNIINHKQQLMGMTTGNKKDDATAPQTSEQVLAMEDYEDMLCQHEESRKHEPDNIFLRELLMPMAERGTEALVIRERIQKQVLHLSEWFRLDKDLEEAFATQELNLIKISPWTWLPLVPILSLAASVDLAHDIANPGALEAVASSGYFLATPGVFFPLLSLQLLKLGWGLFNFWKMAAIKDMLIPRITYVQPDGPWQVIPPAGECHDERRSFQSTPWFAQPVEALFAKPATNRVHELFGTVGGNGVEFYFESIKLHTWLCVATLVAFAFQIVPRDMYALFSGAEGVGIPSLLGPELLVQGSYALLNIVFLLYVSPVAFMNFAIISCVERAVARNEPASVFGDQPALAFGETGATMAAPRNVTFTVA